jgi:acetolactate synthase I/II/III large subunit
LKSVFNGKEINPSDQNHSGIAESGRPGATFISARQKIMKAGAVGDALTSVAPVAKGSPDANEITAAVDLINRAERPILLLGLVASRPHAAESVRALLAKIPEPLKAAILAIIHSSKVAR